MKSKSLVAPKSQQRRKMDAAVKAKMEKLFNPWQPMNSLEEIFPANSHTQV